MGEFFTPPDPDKVVSLVGGVAADAEALRDRRISAIGRDLDDASLAFVLETVEGTAEVTMDHLAFA